MAAWESSVDRIGIDCLGVFGLPPVLFVELARGLGCRYISHGVGPVGPQLSGHPPWSLADVATRRALAKALADNDVSIGLGEGFIVQPGKDVGAFARHLEIFGELHTPRISAVSMEPDEERSLDQFAKLAEMAKPFGIAVAVEFIPGFAVATLADALSVIRHAGSDNVKILVDCMHLVRSGGSAADLEAVAPERIGYAQLCDVPLVSSFGSYLEEAMYERLVPGQGQLPLADILAALPEDVVIGIEIPRKSRLEMGEGPRERLAPCVEAARRLVTSLHRAEQDSS